MIINQGFLAPCLGFPSGMKIIAYIQRPSTTYITHHDKTSHHIATYNALHSMHYFGWIGGVSKKISITSRMTNRCLEDRPATTGRIFQKSMVLPRNKAFGLLTSINPYLSGADQKPWGLSLEGCSLTSTYQILHD